MKRYLAWLPLALLAACGTENDRLDDQIGTPVVSPTPLVGVLLDSRVAGVAYSSASQSGSTDLDGQFRYRDGEVVAFRIGSTDLGAATGRPVLTINELLGFDPAQNLDGQQPVLNLARLLQSLDADADPANGIRVNFAVRDLQLGPLAFAQSAEAFAADPVVESLLQAANVASLVQENVARTHLEQSLRSLSDNGGQANDRPKATASLPEVANEGAQITATGSDSFDPDGIVVSYSWRELSGLGVQFDDPSAANPLVQLPLVEGDQTLELELTIVDDDGAKSSCTVSTIVSDAAAAGPTPSPSPLPNRQPIASAGSDQAVAAGAEVILDGGDSSDPDGDALEFEWRQNPADEVQVALSGAQTAIANFTAPSSAEPLQLRFTLDVADGRGGQATDGLSIMVAAAGEPGDNQAPSVVISEAPETVDESSSGTLVAEGSDPEGSELHYLWDDSQDECGFTFSPNDGPDAATTEFVTPATEVQRDCRIRVTVTDAAGLSASDTVTIVLQDTDDSGADLTVEACLLLGLPEEICEQFGGAVR